MEIPEGLIFASEMENQQQAPQQHFHHHHNLGDSRIRGASRGEHTEIGKHSSLHDDDDDDDDHRRQRRRLHPIHRIYRGEGARIRRRMEEIENSLPYFRTGIRGDPNHELQYRNHPFDRMRRERERMRELKERTEKQQHEQQKNTRDELVERENKDMMEEVPLRNLQEDGTTASTTGGGTDSTGGEDENPFRPIRIHLDTTAIDAERTESNGAQIDFVKNTILPRMTDFWSSALSVVPVSGNVVVSSADLQGRLYCGDSEFSKVPASHISEGVANTDLILYVSGTPSARFCGPTTLAVAVACNFDQVSELNEGVIQCVCV